MARIHETYVRLFKQSFFQRSSIPKSQRRSIAFCLFFFLVFPVVYISTQLCLALDWLLFPGLLRTEIKAPVFIVANPRSGTTILHRVMSLDQQFYFFRSWEMIFPSLVQKYFLDALGWLDARLGQPFARSVEAAETRRFDRLNRAHQVGLFLPEEDDKMLLHILGLVEGGFFFPYGDFAKYAHFDEEIDPQERERVMSFYDGCVRRQAYLRGRPDRRMLSKNPWFTGKIETLRTRYPDARLIYLVRNPLEVIPSMISLGRILITEGFGEEPGPDFDEEAYGIAKQYYLEVPEKLARWTPNRSLTVNYHTLVREPEETIRSIYQQLEIPLSPEYAERLHQEAEKMKQHKSKHRYSLGNCHISQERILNDLRSVIDKYGFEIPQSVDQTPAAAPNSPATDPKNAVSAP